MGGAYFLAAFVVLVSITSLSTHVDGKIARKGCDIFQGNWVLDSSYPLYESWQCPFIEEQFDCRKNGRPDMEYAKYRWQPSGCKLPRFNGVELLRKLKGKEVMFVGDSLSLNQWQSLTCMLHVAAPQAFYTSQTIDGLSTFTFPEYDVSLKFSRNAFLVDIKSEERGRVLRLDSISTAKFWRGMNVLIFDSWHWWIHTGRKQPWDWVVYENTTVKDMNRLVAYERALNTWAKWIDSNVDPTKTQVFFQGVSPDHDSVQGSSAANCGGQTQPLKRPGSPHPAEVVLENVLRSMGKPVYLLNITRLSQVRIDGHPSVYVHGGHKDMDCSHWCLSGVPDIWNQLLYTMLI
ncbi:protein trichome birefringence-like 43 [Sesamum alatum]|uniref:Protein trichome birefringence-like 43 n=1 Tax=Sesamum alatum TaxID=300844 RepID=A0AAE1YY67_9LAMI|nr:protein trichome birefringence-like 43 [Sesamum alatum]